MKIRPAAIIIAYLSAFLSLALYVQECRGDGLNPETVDKVQAIINQHYRTEVWDPYYNGFMDRGECLVKCLKDIENTECAPLCLANKYAEYMKKRMGESDEKQ